MRQSLLGNAATGAGAPGSPAYTVLLDQLNASCEELEVRKEEVLILRSQLVSQKEAMTHKVDAFSQPASGVGKPVCSVRIKTGSFLSSALHFCVSLVCSFCWSKG